MTELNASDFKHKITVKVRFNEVDMLGVCNNAVYINYFETARLEYIKELGLVPEGGLFSDNRLYFMVRNEINYKDHARYDDELNIYSRISFIKNSSFGFDHLVENNNNKSIIADGKGVIVHVNPKTRKAEHLPEMYYDIVAGYEPSVIIVKNK